MKEKRSKLGIVGGIALILGGLTLVAINFFVGKPVTPYWLAGALLVGGGIGFTLKTEQEQESSD